jgi:5-methylthioribose kinase
MLADAPSRAALLAEQQRFIDSVYADMIGFAAVKMIRRIFGFARVIDFEEIANPDRRAACERAPLELARAMLVGPEQFGTVAGLVAAARAHASVLRFS